MKICEISQDLFGVAVNLTNQTTEQMANVAFIMVKNKKVLWVQTIHTHTDEL